MCLILMSLRVHPRYPLVLAMNRDEFHGRPTAPAHWWVDEPILGGRDLASRGSWLAITPAGRWAAVTNYRESLPDVLDAPSRGELVTGFARATTPPLAYLEEVASRGERYHGFNLLVGDSGSAGWWSNRSGNDEPRPLAPGIYGLSNHLLDTPWPKVERGKRSLRDLLARKDLSPDALLELLIDRTVAADDELSDTGLDPAAERALSSAFVEGAEYGTRASTALLLDSEGKGILVERTYEPGTTRWAEVRHQFRITREREPTA